jgi:hypothetical protein
MRRAFSHMKRAALVVAAAALAALCGAAHAAEPWVGTWAAEKSWCRSKEFEERPIVITRKGYEGLENRCRFTSIEKRGSKWHLRARCSSEGRSYRERYIYELRGQKLVIIFPDRGDGEETFVRCP